MDEADALREQHAELAAVLGPLTDDDFDRPAPRCPGWTVADVVLHLAQTDELAAGSVQGRFGEVAASLLRGAAPAGDTIDDAVETMVQAERGSSHADLRRRREEAAAALDAAFARVDPHARVQWVAGEMSVRTLATTRLAENWIHTADVADAVGVALTPAERLRHVARLAWRTLPYAFQRAGRTMHGPVAFDLTGPAGERWRFAPDETASTTITGDGVDLCLVAARRVQPATTSLRGDGPDAAAVLELVRTYA